MPFSISAAMPPAAAPGPGAGPGPAYAGRAGPCPAPGGAGRAGQAWSSGPVAGPVRRGPARVHAPGAPVVRRGPPVRLPVLAGSRSRAGGRSWSGSGAVLRSWSGSWSGAAISESNRDFSAPYTGPKISSDFPGDVFYAHGLSLVSWYINAPPIVPPRLLKINWKFWRLPRRKCSRFRHFRQKPPGIFGQK